MRDEIHDLTVELQSLLADLQARGHEVDVAPEPTPPQAPVARWATSAREAREAMLVGEAGLGAVRRELGDCQRCGLCRTRTNIVFGTGDPSADLVIIGEGPGQQEDQRGEPFVGPSGEMLDKMLVHVLGLERRQAYILNIVKCRPPGNRDPSPEEVEACRPFLHGQLRALQPKVALTLGRVAFQALFGTSEGIKRSRGRWRVWQDPETGLEVPVMPTFHPAYLLREPDDKRLTFDDLKLVRARYDAEQGRRG